MTEPKQYEARLENRTFYFTITKQSENEIGIVMYSQPYTLIKEDRGWANHPINAMQMSKELVLAVVKAAVEQ